MKDFYIFAEFNYKDSEFKFWDHGEDDSIVTKMIENPSSDDGSFSGKTKESAAMSAIVSLIDKYTKYYEPICISYNNTILTVFIDDTENYAVTVQINEIEEKIA